MGKMKGGGRSILEDVTTAILVAVQASVPVDLTATDKERRERDKALLARVAALEARLSRLEEGGR